MGTGSRPSKPSKVGGPIGLTPGAEAFGLLILALSFSHHRSETDDGLGRAHGHKRRTRKMSTFPVGMRPIRNRPSQ
jgi:hypothetical protein